MAVKPSAYVFGKIVFDAGEQVHGNAIEHVVRLRSDGLAIAAPGHLHAAVEQLDRLHLRFELHQVSDLAHEPGDDAIHAADRLHHHRRLIVGLSETHDLHEA